MYLFTGVVLANEAILLLLGYASSFFIAWCIGSNDASNPTETAVGAGALSLRKALLLFSVFAGVGAIAQGWMVMKTLGKGVVPQVDIYGAIASVVGAGIWITVASYKGIPVSTSQSITGAVVGVGFAYVLMGRLALDGIKWDVVVKIILSWITSPVASVFLAAALYVLFFKTIARQRGAVKALRLLLIFSLIFSAYSFGANDVGNATGVYLAVTQEMLGLPDTHTRLFLAVLGSMGIALGGFTLGRKVIATVAYRVTRLEMITGAAAELSNALVVWLFTTLPYMFFGYGMPISTTHASVSSVIGVGLARYGVRGVNWRIVLLIVLSWLLTLPITIMLGMTLRYTIYMITGI